MNRAQRQVIAEKISSTVRVLELLGFEYTVPDPRHERVGGNRSPRVIHVDVGEKTRLRVYNGVSGGTWAYAPVDRFIADRRNLSVWVRFRRKRSRAFDPRRSRSRPDLETRENCPQETIAWYG
jgi:hypothetical protein